MMALVEKEGEQSVIKIVVVGVNEVEVQVVGVLVVEGVLGNN